MCKGNQYSCVSGWVGVDFIKVVWLSGVGQGGEERRGEKIGKESDKTKQEQ